jgi:hypothetical protein
MSKTKNLQGIIFKISNSGDADKVLNLITRGGERVTLFAKSVKKAGSRKAYAIEIGNCVKAKVVEGYGIPIISDIQIVSENIHWKAEYKLMFFLQMIFEVLDKFLYEGNNEIQVYRLIEEVMSLNQIHDTRFIVSTFIIKLLKITGNLPEKFFVPKFVTQSENISKSQIRIYKSQKFATINKISESLKINLDKAEKDAYFLECISFVEEIIGKELKSKKVVIGL